MEEVMVQLMMPSPAVDFNSESTNTTPYATAPSTPQRFPTFFYSAPTSPTHQFLLINSSPTDDSFKKPLFEDDDDDDDGDFAFDFSGQIEPPSISAADELFDCGKIKPLKPVSNHSRVTEKASKKKDLDHFTWALNQTPGDQNPSKRGREKTTTTRDKVSSSQFRISDILSDEETHHQKNSITHSSSSLTWYNKWNLKNLLLFRSASEGSARRIKEPVNKYSRIRKSSDEDDVMMKNNKSSLRSKEGGNRRVMRKVSAHEIHYTANRAVAEEMRKKTFLPYKSGLLGCLGFHNNGGSVHEISRGINSVMKQRG